MAESFQRVASLIRLARTRTLSQRCRMSCGTDAGFMRLKLLGVVLLAASAAILWAARGARSRSDAMETTRGPFTSPEASAQPVRTKIEAVQEFLGAKWPLLEARLTDQQWSSLAEPFVPSDCPPWAEVEIQLRDQIRKGLQAGRPDWVLRFRDKGLPPDFNSGVLNPTAKPLEVRNLDRIQAIISAVNIELDPLADLAFDLFVEAGEAIWDQRLYDACPFVDMSFTTERERSGHAVYIEKWKLKVWTVSYTIDSSEWPTFDAILTEMAGIAARRDQAIAAYIESI